MQILLVDDEPLAVDYLVDTLDDNYEFDNKIIKAYSSKDALNKLANKRVDLLLTDVQMPGMNGIELANVILSMWPNCRVIFLSSYNDFDYIQSAIRIGSVDYVLKAEGDEAIVQAIEKAINKIKTERNKEDILQRSKHQYKMALPSLRSEYLRNLLDGGPDDEAERSERFRELEIDLDPQNAMMAILGSIDGFGGFSKPADRTHLFYAVDNIAIEQLQKCNVRVVSFQHDRNRIVWIIQPNHSREFEEIRSIVNKNVEQIQNSCERLLGIPLSIAVASQVVNWESLGSQIDSLKMHLNFRMGYGESMLIIEPASEIDVSHQSRNVKIEIRNIRTKLRKLDLLDTYMDNGITSNYIRAFNKLLPVDKLSSFGEEDKWFSIELFSYLSAYFLSYLNSRKLLNDPEISINMEKLLDSNQHYGWSDMLDYFFKLGTEITEYNERKQVEHTNSIIGKIHLYINEYLHEDLSLSKLAEVVYLSPSYFSKVYKDLTGQGLLEYINEARINRAKELLGSTDKRINQIALEIGLESASYFTRLFRKITGVSPQRYRDNIRRLKE